MRTSVADLQDLLGEIHLSRLGKKGRHWYKLVDLYEARYDLGPVAVAVDIRNGKVFKLIAQGGYKGQLLGNIEVDMNVGEAMRLEPNLYYDEAEEGIFVWGSPGVVLDVPAIDPYPEEVPSHPISAISVYAEEAFTPEGQRGRW